MELLFWICFCLVIYTYVGYGVVLFLLVKIKELFVPIERPVLPSPLPDVTLFIAAYNEAAIVVEKMNNCRALNYPKERLHIVWVTDGSNDNSPELLKTYPEVTLFHQSERRGKMAAFNRGMKYVKTPYVVFTDANTLLNAESVNEIIRLFSNPKVGCVAGEKRVIDNQSGNVAATEGIYWKYESFLKEYDDRLYSAMGAAGELFAIRTKLYEELQPKILLDDFILSMHIAQRGYKIAYCKTAFACEGASLNMTEEAKRKVRIAAGGLQSVALLASLLNPCKYPKLTFQYVSHRVLRWTLTPLALVSTFILNLLLVCEASATWFYGAIFCLQCLFYAAAGLGYLLSKRGIKNKILYVPYYFVFMNLNVFKGVRYLLKTKNMGVWEKAKRA